MNRLPKEVPILDATDLCVVPMSKGGCGCLLHWTLETFDGWAGVEQVSPALLAAHDQLKTGVPEEHARIFEAATGETPDHREFITNDQVRRPRAILARVWNRAMAILGYVVNNPECTKAGTLKPV